MTDYIEKLTQDYLLKIDENIKNGQYNEAMEYGVQGMEELKNYKKEHFLSWIFFSNGFFLEQIKKRTAYAEFCKVLHKLKIILYTFYLLKKNEEWLEQKSKLISLDVEIKTLVKLLEVNQTWKTEQYNKEKTLSDMAELIFRAYTSLLSCETIENVHKTFEMLSLFSNEEKKEFSKRLNKKKEKSSSSFDITLLNTDTNLNRLTEQIIESNATQFSLCLYGAPGTGKSAYARYLAERMGVEVIMKRASDLFSKWVGESEKAIAAAFKEAEEKGAMLIFDEADSFLQDRSGLSEPWEISSVNEMLTWMENATIPFVCTTNLMSSLDKASLRRFIFKVKYDYLTPSQVNIAFKLFFYEEPKVSLAHLDKMAPGDFMVVKKKATVLKITNHQELLEMLEQEMEAKNL